MDGRATPGQTRSVDLELSPLSVQIERGRSALRVVARSVEPSPSVLIEATFSGGPDGVWLRLTRAGRAPQILSKEALAQHPALSGVLRLIADEVDFPKPLRVVKPHGEAVLGLLFQTLLVYVARMPVAVPLPRWGRPLRDERVERALELLTSDIAKRWTVELLARAVGLSRPVLAERFLRVLGLSPMRYLSQQRMQVAAALLLGTDASLAEVAARIGYQSEFAFNRAFKRHFQVPPGVYRQRIPTSALAGPLALAA